ncbi:MAG: tetratricopeptide repeat protein [Bdellovibrionales bacterium]|nr:tetratricopeptide repeat protein [Bdellovibrionales bacterium]
MDSEFIRRYQSLYDQEPSSRIFAPLAEAYRKEARFEEALSIAERGVLEHPHFASGRVTLGRILIDLGRVEEALDHLEKAVETAPENILAHRLLAEAYLQLKDRKNSLKSFKMVLFLNPTDERAEKQIRRLESITAADYEEETFQLQSLRDTRLTTHQEDERWEVDRAVSLCDAFIVRNDFDRALEVLESLDDNIKKNSEIKKRLAALKNRAPSLDKTSAGTEVSAPDTIELQTQQIVRTNEKIEFLEGLMQRIKNRSQHHSG